ncbi:MAG: GHMP kinase [Planctomycetota bacterium]|nr:GHMP kinase [Planctomycetota bacterium]
MEVIKRRAYARAGLMGNPSDGYGGRTISFTIPDFFAEVVLYEWEDLEVIPSQQDHGRFGSIQELAQDVRLHGYYGGIRLVKATIKRFVDFCQGRHELHDRNFSIRYETNIPRQVGLAGSSAIIVATLAALLDFYQLDISRELQPSLALSVEKDELGIAAGLQDRVIQVYGGLVQMDFTESALREQQGLCYGQYEKLDASILPPLYVAYADELGEPTEVVHNDLQSRFQQGDVELVQAMQQLADITQQARGCLENGDGEQFGRLLDENFSIRQSICQIHPDHLAMVEAARSTGATAKFAGSGGAIVGTYRDETMYQALCQVLSQRGCQVLRPTPT